jgi:hypothetical protein
MRGRYRRHLNAQIHLAEIVHCIRWPDIPEYKFVFHFFLSLDMRDILFLMFVEDWPGK